MHRSTWLTGLSVAAMGVILLAPGPLRAEGNESDPGSSSAPSKPQSVADQTPKHELVQVFHIKGMFGGVVCKDVHSNGEPVLVVAGSERWSITGTLLFGGRRATRRLDALRFPVHLHTLDGALLGSIGLGPGAGEPPVASRILLAQLDEDPQKEFVLFGALRPFISAHDTNGTRLWALPTDLFAQAGAGDVDGDALDEVLIAGLEQGLELFDSDGALLWKNSDIQGPFWNFGFGDLEGSGSVQIVVGGRGRAPLLQAGLTGRQPGDVVTGVIVIGPHGRTTALYPVPLVIPEVAVGELVESEPGDEIVVWGEVVHPEEQVCLAAMSGSGELLWVVVLGTSFEARPRVGSIGVGCVGVVTRQDELLVFSSRGELLARKTGFGNFPAVDITTDASGGPLIVVASSNGAFAFRLSQRATPPEPVVEE